MRRDDVDPAGAQRLGVVLLGRDEKEGREADEFPAGEEGPRVSGGHHHERGPRSRRRRAAELAPVLRVLLRPVAFAVDRSEGRDEEDGHEEEGGEAVDREAVVPPGNDQAYSAATGFRPGRTEAAAAAPDRAAGDVQDGRDPLSVERPVGKSRPAKPLTRYERGAGEDGRGRSCQTCGRRTDQTSVTTVVRKM